MVEFLLVVYLGGGIISQTQRFEDMDRCLYFAEKLSSQGPVPKVDGGYVTMKAICKPVPKR